MGSSRRFALRTVLAEAAGLGVFGAAIGAGRPRFRKAISSLSILRLAGIHGCIGKLAARSAGRLMKDNIHVTYRTGELDLLYADEGLWVVLGPNFADDAELASTLDRIAAGGPRNRLGLVPSRSTHRWRFDNQPAKCLLPPCPVACTGMEEVLTNALKVRPEVPVAVWRCGDYLCVFCDHGVGDGGYIARLVAALTNPAALASFSSPGMSATRHPFALALWTALRQRPLQLVRDAAHIGQSVASLLRTSLRASREPRTAVTAPATPPPRPEYACTVWVSSDPSYLKALRAYRDAAHPSVSTTALTMFAICKSARSVVDEMSDNIEILTDMRRFLPARSIMHGNFASVVQVPLSPRDSPEVFGEALTIKVNSHLALIKLLVIATLSRLRYSLPPERRRPRLWERPALSADRRTKVTFIDWSKRSADAQLLWPDESRAELAGATPPVSSEHMAIVLTCPGDDRMQVTARFHESHIDSGRVRQLLEQALNPANFHLLDDATPPLGPAASTDN